MVYPIENASAYLDKFESDRHAAIAVSEQKVEEAKLIRARQEGFRAAMEILTSTTSISSCESQSAKPGRRRPRRDIMQLILRELSFSGEELTTAQIAKAINYIPERTETALKRLENGGKVRRNERGRWVTSIPASSDKRTPSAVFKKNNMGPPVLNSAENSDRHRPLNSAEHIDRADQ
jgi:DNA-binding transcriptional ArsR family regulator